MFTLVNRNRYGYPHTIKASKNPPEADNTQGSNIIDDLPTANSDNFIDFHHESASQRDSETLSLMSFKSYGLPAKQSISFPSRKSLPLVSFLLFLVTNVLPVVISCGLAPSANCIKLKFLELSPLFQWIYMVVLAFFDFATDKTLLDWKFISNHILCHDNRRFVLLYEEEILRS